jgi:hypothetical protein
MDELKYLKSAINKLKRRKKLNGYYEGADILKAPEKISLLLLSFIIIIPIFTGLLILLMNLN